MIKRLTQTHLQSANDIILACKEKLIELNIPQWVPEYPNQLSLIEDINHSEIYGYFENELLGIMTLHNRQDPEYQLINWQFEEPVYTIHRLCVHPNHEGKGVAHKLMSFAETYARDKHANSIRLDAFSLNKRALSFYERRGYINRGIAFFKYRNRPFYCYEFNLKTQDSD